MVGKVFRSLLPKMLTEQVVIKAEIPLKKLVMNEDHDQIVIKSL
jgi:hypothetical protein